jgi:hypothetical protein
MNFPNPVKKKREKEKEGTRGEGERINQTKSQTP